MNKYLKPLIICATMAGIASVLAGCKEDTYIPVGMLNCTEFKGGVIYYAEINPDKRIVGWSRLYTPQFCVVREHSVDKADVVTELSGEKTHKE